MTDLPASYLHSVNEGRLGKSLAQVVKQIVDQLSSHFAQRSETAETTISCNTTLCFFLGDKFNGSTIFDIRGQHEVLEVKVITHIRTIINYPCRPLLVHFKIKLMIS